MKHLLVLTAILATCCLTFAQGTPHYAVATPTATTTDETTGDCATSGTKNCFHKFNNSGGPTLRTLLTGSLAVGISDGSDGSEELYALASDDTFHEYQLDTPSGTWSTLTLTGAPASPHYMFMGSGINQLYVFGGTTPANELWSWNGTSWTDMSTTGDAGCYSGSDGDLYINHGGVLKQYNGTSWSTVTIPTGHSGLNTIVCSDTMNIWLVYSDGTVYSNYNQSGFTWATVTLASGTLEELSAYGVDGMIELTNDSTNNVYIFNAANATWTHETGLLSDVVVGDEYPIGYYKNGTTNEYWHLYPQKVSIADNVNGNYDCTGFPLNQCPNGSSHSGTMKVTWTSGGTNGNVTGSGVPPASDLAVYATGYTEDCDPFSNEDDSNCEVTTDGTVACAVMGAIFDGGQTLGQEVRAYTFGKMQGPPVPNGNDYGYNLANGCTTGTTPPLCGGAGNPPTIPSTVTVGPDTNPVVAKNANLMSGWFMEYFFTYDETFKKCFGPTFIFGPLPPNGNTAMNCKILTGVANKFKIRPSGAKGVQLAMVQSQEAKPTHDMKDMK